MKTFLIGAVAALGLGLAILPGNASAYWAVRTTYRYDPVLAAMVPVQERYWVPDVVVTPPVYVAPAPVRVYTRPYYWPSVNFYFRYRR